MVCARQSQRRYAQRQLPVHTRAHVQVYGDAYVFYYPFVRALAPAEIFEAAEMIINNTDGLATAGHRHPC